MKKYFTIILISIFCIRTNGFYQNETESYNEDSYDDGKDSYYENDNMTNEIDGEDSYYEDDNMPNEIDDDEQEPATEDMYESDEFYYRHKPTFDEKYLNDHIINDTNVIYDENWPYPEEDEIGFNVTASSKFRCGRCKCGRRFRTRIIGGHYTSRKRYPWMVLLALHKSFICGASLINSRYILTAAHCTQGNRASVLTARFRMWKRSDASIPPRTIARRISRYWIHARFNSRTLDYDISLCKLKRPVNSFRLILPICLPQPFGSWGGAGRKGYVSGWGDITKDPSIAIYANQLKQVQVPVITNQKCRRRIRFAQITSRMICAGKENRDSCQGDSGGPMVVKYRRPIGRAKQLGIVSWSIGCGGRYPGVYTRVPKFVDWIKNRARRGACWCR